MRFRRTFVCCCIASSVWLRSDTPDEAGQSAASIASSLKQISLDPEETYRVRDLQLSRGGVRIFLTEGVLSFAKPVAGHRLAAVFSTTLAEAGDAEIIALPPQRSERASLASYTGSPNLDEHFVSATFFFSDDTYRELLSQIDQRPVHKAAELGQELQQMAGPVLRDTVSQIEIRAIESLLDNHPPAEGFFYATIDGRNLHTFNTLYEPREFEPISLGRFTTEPGTASNFQLWTSFRSAHGAAQVSEAHRISEYRIETTVRADLSMSVQANFKWKAVPEDGRVSAFGLSARLRLRSAKIDGVPVELEQPNFPDIDDGRRGGSFLLISKAPLDPNGLHEVSVQYEGSVIRKTRDGTYFVDERNAWFPYHGSTAAAFDLTFHCPENLRLVSTGELVRESVDQGVRTIQRKTVAPVAVAGFNLGDYEVARAEQGRYDVECYGNKPSSGGEGAQSGAPVGRPLTEILKETQDILNTYTGLWGPLPIHNVAISPIAGYFGQGFPGLIYLSTVSYIRPEARPAKLRNPRLDAFFSDMLLPHEIAHQWWGNLVSSADYRSNWLLEAMANDSALQYLERAKGKSAADAVLAQYRDDLLHAEGGHTVESAGPVDFGLRLLTSYGLVTWRTILYEKGTWILHMLRQRLGDDGFHTLQKRILDAFSGHRLSNEDFRKLASELVPAGQPDRTLTAFFDTWVYGTGIPRLSLQARKPGAPQSLEVSGVDDEFTADLPLKCRNVTDITVRWVKATAGELPLSFGGTCELPSSTEYLYQ